MSRILFVNDVSLAHLRRGTPIRLYHLLREIKKKHELIVCVNDVPNDFKNIFIPYPKDRGLKRIFFLKKIIDEHNIDVVFTGTEINIKLPVLLKMITGVKIAIDLHGLYYEELYLSGKIDKFKKYALSFQVHLFLFAYNRIFAVSEKLKKYYFLNRYKTVVIYGGVDIATFPKFNISSPKVFTIGYMGNSRLYQGLNDLLEAAYELKLKNKETLKLNLILSEFSNDLKNKIEELNLINECIITINVPQDQAFKKVLNSSVLVIPRPKSKITDYSYPSKLPEFLYTGRLVIITDVGPVLEFNGIDNFSEVISNVNIKKGLIAALLKVKCMSEEDRNEVGLRARDFVRNNLSWERIGVLASKSLDF